MMYEQSGKQHERTYGKKQYYCVTIACLRCELQWNHLLVDCRCTVQSTLRRRSPGTVKALMWLGTCWIETEPADVHDVRDFHFKQIVK